MDGGRLLKDIVARLEGIKEEGKQAYEVQYKELNSVYFGVPQTRRRLFIIGVGRTCQSGEFKWPEATGSLPVGKILERVEGENPDCQPQTQRRERSSRPNSGFASKARTQTRTIGSSTVMQLIVG